MAINLIYIFTILVAIYYGIRVYAHTKHKMILRGLAILIASLVLELQRLNLGSYLMDTTDFFRTIRDITWTVVMMYLFRLAYKIK